MKRSLFFYHGDGKKKMTFKIKEEVTVCISYTFSYTRIVEHHEEEVQLCLPLFQVGKGMPNCVMAILEGKGSTSLSLIR